MVSLLGTEAQAAPFYASTDGSMVWDEATGLGWARCSLGQKWTGKTCAGDASWHRFDDAKAAALRFNAAGGLGGAKDQGLPAIRQLVNLRACSTGPISDVRDLPDGGEPVPIWCADVPVKPTIDPLAFASTPADFYGSSSAAAGEGAWAVYLHVGSTSHSDRSDQYAARLTVSPMQVQVARSRTGLPQPRLPSTLNWPEPHRLRRPNPPKRLHATG